MSSNSRRRYSEDHWLRSPDPERVLRAYQEQQSKVYSRVKTKYVLELLGNLQGSRFLDYGCGGGMFVVLAGVAGAAQVVGVDAEEGALRAARHFVGKEGVEKPCSFLHSRNFPSFPAGTCFDVVLMKDVIEHVEEDQALLDAAAKTLAPGGNLVLCTQNALSLNFVVEGMVHRVIRGKKDWYGWDPTHLRFYTPRMLRERLHKAGLRCVAWRSAYLVPYKLPPLPFSHGCFFRMDWLSMVDRILGRIAPFHRMGWSIMVKAVKSG